MKAYLLLWAAGLLAMSLALFFETATAVNSCSRGT